MHFPNLTSPIEPWHDHSSIHTSSIHMMRAGVIPPSRISLCSIPNMSGWCCHFFKLSVGRRVPLYTGIMTVSGRPCWICLWMKPQDQHKLPKQVLLRSFSLYLSPHDPLFPSSSPNRTAPVSKLSMVFKSCCCLFEVLLCYLGSLCWG